MPSFQEAIAGDIIDTPEYVLLRLELGERVITRLAMEQLGLIELGEDDFMSWQTYRSLLEDDIYNTELPDGC